MKSWKALELRTAKSLGVRRTPLSGGSDVFTKGDVIHPTLYIECKYRARHAVVGTFMEVRQKARLENRIPVLVLKENKRHGELAVIDWQLFLKLWREYDTTQKGL